MSSCRLVICAYLSVSGQFVEQSVVEPDTLEYDQTLSFLAVVFRALVVLALEEKSRRIQAGEFEVSEQEKAYALYD